MTNRLPKVSIHARHCCRANPSSSQAAASSRASFNPRPALLPGESMEEAEGYAKLIVSIHARHCCRANPPGAATGAEV